MDEKFESIWDKYISSVKTLDTTQKFDPSLFTTETPTYLNGSTEPLKIKKEESVKLDGKFGMGKVFRGKQVTLGDLLELPVVNAGWWNGFGNSAEDKELEKNRVESMDVADEIIE